MDARKQALLRAAQHLFRRYGPQKTTIGDIARSAGVGVGTVYLEFPNKDAILLELSQAGHRSVLKAVQAAWASGGPVDERLRRALRARTEAFWRLGHHGLHGADLFHCADCAPIASAHRAFRAAEEELFASYLLQGAREGALSMQSPAVTARALMWAYETFTPPALFARDERRLLGDLRSLHDLVFPGLLAR